MNMQTLSSAKTLADFRPFKAWRYNLDRVKIGNVIAPPYDVISQDEQASLYAKDPFNCIRLILNREEASDSDQNNRYTRARQFYTDWKKEQILTQETTPCFYYYKQTFRHPVTGEPKDRAALLGRLKLASFDKRIVIPHEKTLSKPRADRRRLLEATRTNFSPVFGLYEYDHGQQDAVQNLLKKDPLFSTTDAQGVQHNLWAIRDPQIIEGIHRGLSSQCIYIADGHHRYQTSLEYAQEQRKLRKVAEDVELDSDFVLMALVHFYDPGMVILPTHRMILPFDGYQPERMIQSLKSLFRVEAMPFEKIEKHLHAGSEKTGVMEMGLYLENGQSFLLTLDNPSAARSQMPQGKADVWYQLDVSVVSHLILGKLWGIPETDWESKIRYTHSDQEALQQVKSRQVAATFFLRAPQVEILRDMGKAQELMPQKSTFFYPKLASGLLFHEHAN